MATAINLTTTTIFIILTLLLILDAKIADTSSTYIKDTNEVYVLDNVPVSSFRTRSRFLTSSIKKGAHCNPGKSICNGVSANNGTSLLHCCKMHCRNVLSDKVDCGRCGNKCKFGQLCCHGSCTDIVNNDNHCGNCNKKCPSGIKCDFGTCGYA